jgi:hypothetical protein
MMAAPHPVIAEFTSPDQNLSRSLSAVDILRFQISSATAPVELLQRSKLVEHLRARWFTHCAHCRHWQKAIQYP